MNLFTFARVGLLPLVGSQSIITGMLVSPFRCSAKLSACFSATMRPPCAIGRGLDILSYAAHRCRGAAQRDGRPYPANAISDEPAKRAEPLPMSRRP